MRTSLIATCFAFAATLVSAQEPYWNISSAPFALVLTSKNATLNGSTLFACHEGAAIEGFCVGPKITKRSTKEFYLNTTVYDDGKLGLLAWTLRTGTYNISSPMELTNNEVSNVAIPLLFPGDSGTSVGFDKKNKLYIQAYGDDTVVPQNREVVKSYYRWYACITYYGYQYHTLAWVIGEGKPQNPTCQKVDVVRVF